MCVFSVAGVVIRLGLGAVFVASALQKGLHWPEFYQAAQNYHVLPPVWTHAYALMLPWLEGLAGLYLLLGLFTRFAAGLTAGLLLSFLVALLMVVTRGDSVACGCFVGGGPSEPVGWELIWRDGGLLLLVVWLLWRPETPFSLDAWLSGPASAEKAA